MRGTAGKLPGGIFLETDPSAGRSLTFRDFFLFSESLLSPRTYRAELIYHGTSGFEKNVGGFESALFLRT